MRDTKLAPLGAGRCSVCGNGLPAPSTNAGGASNVLAATGAALLLGACALVGVLALAVVLSAVVLSAVVLALGASALAAPLALATGDDVVSLRSHAHDTSPTSVSGTQGRSSERRDDKTQDKPCRSRGCP